jgi:hypothetical protein
MTNKKEDLEERTTTIGHIVTDQGNGGPHCDNCYQSLDVDRVFAKIGSGERYTHCPGCGYRFVGHSEPWINQGGSDF